MTSVSPPPIPPLPSQRPRQRGIRWSRWNLLLLVPLFILLTPLYNRVGPTLFSIPFFYWFQIFSLIVGVTVTTVVYRVTRGADHGITDRPDRLDPNRLDVDSLDEGAAR
jgi:Protein of unknown function (DUF3311)